MSVAGRCSALIDVPLAHQLEPQTDWQCELCQGIVWQGGVSTTVKSRRACQGQSDYFLVAPSTYEYRRKGVAADEPKLDTSD